MTISLEYLAMVTCRMLCEKQCPVCPTVTFRRILYLALKTLQRTPHVLLHPSLDLVARYASLLSPPQFSAQSSAQSSTMKSSQGDNSDFSSFVAMAEHRGLLRQRNGILHVASPSNAYRPSSPKFRNEKGSSETSGDADESDDRPIVRLAIDHAWLTLSLASPTVEQILALEQFDDQCRLYRQQKHLYSASCYQEINRLQTATVDAAPYFWPRPTDMPPHPVAPLGILLVHGFLSSPAELKPFATTLRSLSLPILGVRLPGHGTSPWDLKTKNWSDWLDAIHRGIDILRPFCHRFAVVGFSAGGALTLALAAERPHDLAGVAAVSAPLRFCNRKMALVPVIQRLNSAARWLPPFAAGVMPFRINASEHPEINYRHMPLAGVYQLHRLRLFLRRRLAKIRCPVLLVQGDHDPMVDPTSAHLIFDLLTCSRKRLHMVPSHRHGILYENIGDTWTVLAEYLRSLAREWTDSR